MIEARRPRRWRARLAAVTVVAGVFTAAASVTAPAITATAPNKARPPKVAAIGKYAVGMKTQTFVDNSRPTEGIGPSRTLLTAIYYPAQGPPTDQPAANAPPDTSGAPYPLILFSHGLGARGVVYENVIKTWASAGYVVAAPDYPLSNSNAPGGAQVRPRHRRYEEPTRGRHVRDQPGDQARQGGSRASAGSSTRSASAHRVTRSGASRPTGSPTAAAAPTIGSRPPSRCRGSSASWTVQRVLPRRRDAVAGRARKRRRDGALRGQNERVRPARKPPKFFLTFLGAGHVSPFLGGNDRRQRR